MTTERPSSGATPSEASAVPDIPGTPRHAVRHRTERDASGRVWRFVYDPAAQKPPAPSGMVRLRCTTGTARTMMMVRDDWYDWPRTQLLDELASALKIGRAQITGHSANGASGAPVRDDRTVARRRLVRDSHGLPWNCVYDPASGDDPEHEGHVRVRCTAGRDRIDLSLTPGWHRLGDRQIAELIEQAQAHRSR